MSIRTGITPDSIKTGLRNSINPVKMASLSTPSALINAMGFDTVPNWMGMGKDATGMKDLVGSNDLVDSSTPTHGFVSDHFNSQGVSMSANSSDNVEAASDSVNEAGTGSFAWVWVGEIPNMTEFSSYSIISKREGVGSLYGWEMFTNSWNTGTHKYRADVKTTANDSPYTLSHTVYKDGPHIFLFVYNVTGKTSAFYSLETSEIRTWFTNGDCSNTGKFSLGSGRISSAEASHHLVAYWEGSTAESLDGTNLTNLQSFLGIE